MTPTDCIPTMRFRPYCCRSRESSATLTLRSISSFIAVAILVISLAAPAAVAFRPAPSYTATAPVNRIQASLQPPEQRTPRSSDPSTIDVPSSRHHDDGATIRDEVHQPESSYDGVLLKFKKNGKDKILNTTGLYHLLVIALTLPFWVLSMAILRRLGDAVEGFDDRRAKFE